MTAETETAALLAYARRQGTYELKRNMNFPLHHQIPEKLEECTAGFNWTMGLLPVSDVDERDE